MTRPALPRLIDASRVVPAPWKNGGGTQRDLLRIPPGEHWRIRVSLAVIERDGAFSSFPGVIRHFAIVSGHGVRLRFGDRDVRADAGSAAVTFDGGEDCACRLIDGRCEALNLMLRDRQGGLHRVVPRARHAHPGTCGLFACEAGELAADGVAVRVPAGNLAWFDAEVDPVDAPMRTTLFTGQGWWIQAEYAA